MTSAKLKPSLVEQLVSNYPNQVKDIGITPINFCIDDRDTNDVYPGFCNINLGISDANAETVTIILDNVPYDDQVRSIAADLDGTWQDTRTGKRLTLNLPTAEIEEITPLAQAIHHVVGNGSRYDDRNWKWIAPRTAKSLERLIRIIRATLN